MAKTSEYGLGPFDFPRGWFMVGRSEDATMTAQPLRVFGRDLVLYRGETQPVVLDAYCPHMGSHLCRGGTSFVIVDGQIEGDSIRCPYHAWRFGPDGKCDDIPYHDGPIPAAAKVKSWPVREQMGCIFVWHDPEDMEPDYEPPMLPEWDDPAWVRWTIEDLGTLATHPAEILDNMADLRHFNALHGTRLNYFSNFYEDHTYTQLQGGGHRSLSEELMLESDSFYTGPGILVSRQFSWTTAIQYICHTPIEDGVVRVWTGVMRKSDKPVADDADRGIAMDQHSRSLAAFSQDFDVWRYKEPAVNIMALSSDGPFAKGRLWYSQFYNPREEAAKIQARVNGEARSRDFPANHKEVDLSNRIRNEHYLTSG